MIEYIHDLHTRNSPLFSKCQNGAHLPVNVGTILLTSLMPYRKSFLLALTRVALGYPVLKF